MEIKQGAFGIETDDRFEVTDVTPEVAATVAEWDATDGLVYVSTPNTSAALSTNEYEEKLVGDMVETFERLVPPENGYAHDSIHVETGTQPNAHAHLLSALIKRPVLAVLQDGDIDLGTWESVMFFEFCGPRERTVEVTLLE